jgi:hypothetical protein
MNDLNEKEKKLHEAIFEGKENEYSSGVFALNKLFSKKNEINREFPPFELLLNSVEQEKKIIQFRKKTMNKKIISILGAAAILILGVIVAVINSGSKEQVAQASKDARITFLMGDVKIKAASGSENTKPKIGTLVAMNDVVITSNKATADIEFGDGNTLRIKSNTEVVIRKLIYGDTAVDEEVYLKKGVLVAEVKKKKQNDSFNVMTPTVIAGVRGTKFQVSFDPNANETTRVTVSEGSVGITKQKNEIPLSKEPIEILDANDYGIEKGLGGDIVKNSITKPEVTKIIDGNNDMDESQLLKLHGKTEIEKITLDDKSVIRGVIIDMNDANFIIETLDGIKTISRNRVLTSESVKIK